MSRQARVDTLLANADEAIQKRELVKAAASLREASHLDAANVQIQDRWATVQRLEGGHDALQLLTGFISSHELADGEEALRAVKQKQLPASDGIKAFELLLDVKTELDLLDELTSAVLSSSIDARKRLAAKFSESATPLFELLFQRGKESFNALISVTLENPLWSSAAPQRAAQRDAFRLSIAELIAAGAEHTDLTMRASARLLSSAADKVAELVDTDVFDAILTCLDLRKSASLRAQATLAVAKLFDATRERGEEMFAQFIHHRVMQQTNDDLIVAFSAAAATFPIIPAVASRLFLVDGFVQQLVPNLERNWEEGAAGHRKSQTLETAALELLSAACVDKACREAIKTHCSHWLENLVEEREGRHKALAALILAKISIEASEDMTSKLEGLVLSGDAEADQAIEGLAYTTLQSTVKQEVAQNKQLLQKLVMALKERPSTMFGCLNVFANLTAYRPSQTEEQKKMTQLKAYANSQQPTPEDPLDDEAVVTARCKLLMGVDVVPALVGCCKQTTSPTNVALVVRILLSLAKEQRHRAVMAQQGAVKLLLQIRDRIAKTDKSTIEAAAIERQTSHSLARLLISVNPTHVFSSTLSASSAVSALVPLLSISDDSEHRDLLPTFESLLALTNLASMEDNAVRNHQLRLLWSQLEDHLLLSSNMLVQRASVELLCNLMASPQCAAKFVGDGSKREATRMRILLALTDVEDLATRRAAGGALAMLTEWDAAVAVILDLAEDRGVSALLGMCEDESDEMKHRGLACVMNVVDTPGDIGAKGIAKIKNAGAVDKLKAVLSRTKNGEMLGLGVEILKKLV